MRVVQGEDQLDRLNRHAGAEITEFGMVFENGVAINQVSGPDAIIPAGTPVKRVVWAP